MYTRRVTNKYNQYLTGLKDVDFNILLHLPYNKLKSVCQTNKYTYTLCQNSEFWFMKIENDGLLLPSSQLLTNYSNWIKIYDTLLKITKNFGYCWAVINKHKNIRDLTDKYKISQILIDFEGAIGVTPYKNNKYNLFQVETRFRVWLEAQKVIDFLFDGLINQYFTRIVAFDEYSSSESNETSYSYQIR